MIFLHLLVLYVFSFCFSETISETKRFLQTEEQQVDETDEQFEERVLNKRAYQMFTVVRSKLQSTEQITFTEMCYRNSRKQVRMKPAFSICS